MEPYFHEHDCANTARKIGGFEHHSNPEIAQQVKSTFLNLHKSLDNCR